MPDDERATADASGTDGGPATMRAIRQQVLGGPEVLELVDVPRPDPAPTEVLVRVGAAGVNPVDYKTRASGGFLGNPPFTVGTDVAGEVAALGSGVTRFAVGDRVFGMPRFPREAAAYAEYVTAPSRQLARTPERLTDVEAGALPLAALTAWQALVETADVRGGQRVLVIGAGGGVGHLAVQIATARGAYVVAASRASKHALLTDLGADETIDYTEHAPGDATAEFDVAFDVTGRSFVAALPTLRDGGMLLALTSRVDDVRALAGDRVRVAWLLVEPDRTGLEAVAALVDAGRLRVHVARTFPLAQAGRAHRLLERDHPPGKVVLTVP